MQTDLMIDWQKSYVALVRDIQRLETQAHEAGFHVTGHALNKAKNALGWELTGDIVRARGK